MTATPTIGFRNRVAQPVDAWLDQTMPLWLPGTPFLTSDEAWAAEDTTPPTRHDVDPWAQPTPRTGGTP